MDVPTAVTKQMNQQLEEMGPCLKILPATHADAVVITRISAQANHYKFGRNSGSLDTE